MSGRRKSQSDRPSHEDAKAIRRAVRWLAKIGRLDPLQEGVGRDLADILDGALRDRAVVAVRALNMGTPPVQRERRVRRRGAGVEWSQGEMDMLARLYGDKTLTLADIGERITERYGVVRSGDACKTKAMALGITDAAAPRAYPWRTRASGRKPTPLMEAARRLRERRMQA
jgi:hypothetical protein